MRPRRPRTTRSRWTYRVMNTLTNHRACCRCRERRHGGQNARITQGLSRGFFPIRPRTAGLQRDWQVSPDRVFLPPHLLAHRHRPQLHPHHRHEQWATRLRRVRGLGVDRGIRKVMRSSRGPHDHHAYLRRRRRVRHEARHRGLDGQLLLLRSSRRADCSRVSRVVSSRGAREPARRTF